jgi:hypothetical protein
MGGWLGEQRERHLIPAGAHAPREDVKRIT